MKSSLKIAFICSENANDKTAWSGILFNMFKVLKDTFETVDAIGPVDSFFFKSLGITNRLTQFFISKGYNHKHSFIKSKILGYIFSKKISKKKYDIIFAPAASTEIAFLKTTIPIVYLSDSSFSQLLNYYEIFTNLLDFSVKESKYIEKLSIEKASGFIYPSEWAANFVEKTYNVSKEKFKVIPFGANIDELYIPENINKSFLHDKPFYILFVGVNWKRKGGDIVIQTFQLLLSQGYNVKLIVCGCVPPVKHENVEVYPFLNKNLDSDMVILSTIYKKSNLLFVPTRADCSPIIFCEASAFGLPVLSTNTGGVADLVEDGVNGFCLDYSATPQEYTDIIIRLIKNETEYLLLCDNSKNKYKNELNWQLWAQSVKLFFYELL